MAGSSKSRGIFPLNLILYMLEVSDLEIKFITECIFINFTLASLFNERVLITKIYGWFLFSLFVYGIIWNREEVIQNYNDANRMEVLECPHAKFPLLLFSPSAKS